VTSPIVLDSWAVLAFLENEPAAQTVEDILLESIKTARSLIMTAVNLGEVWYSIARAHSPEDADKSIQRLISIGVKIISADWTLANSAARYKASHPVAYADCFAVALAFLENAALVTGDKEFRQFEKSITIVWV
jgi:uncharacterized protein